MAVVLKEVRVSYVHVIEPAENLSGDLAYSCQVLINKDDKVNVEKMKREIEKLTKIGMEKKWGGKKKKFRYQPLRDGDKELADGDQTDKIYAGKYFFSATRPESFGKPGVVDENLQPVMDKDKIYSGCYCNIQIKGYPYLYSGNAGIGWGLENIMFAHDGDRLDGHEAPEEAFASLAPEKPEDTEDTF